MFVRWGLLTLCIFSLLGCQSSSEHADNAEVNLLDNPKIQHAHAMTKVHAHFGNIEYDRSALADTFSVHFPIYNKEKSQIIGVAKVLVDVLAVVDALQ